MLTPLLAQPLKKKKISLNFSFVIKYLNTDPGFVKFTSYQKLKFVHQYYVIMTILWHYHHANFHCEKVKILNFLYSYRLTCLHYQCTRALLSFSHQVVVEKVADHHKSTYAQRWNNNTPNCPLQLISHRVWRKQ